MNEEFRKSQIAISGMQYDINATNSNMLKQSAEFNEMTMSQGTSTQKKVESAPGLQPRKKLQQQP